MENIAGREQEEQQKGLRKCESSWNQRVYECNVSECLEEAHTSAK